MKREGTLVYRVYDLFDRLLYVGITDELCSRFHAHLSESSWRNRAEYVEWVEFPSRRAATKEEARLIHVFLPPCNIRGVPDRTLPIPLGRVPSEDLSEEVKERQMLREARRVLDQRNFR